jgi:hypothetical protein
MTLPENLNGKYKSIEYGRSKLHDRLARINRLPPKELKVTNQSITSSRLGIPN